MNDLTKNLLLWVVILVVLMTVFQSFSGRRGAEQPLAYSDFLEQVKQGNVDNVVIEDQYLQGTLKSGGKFTSFSPESDNRSMIGALLENNVRFDGQPPKQTPILLQLLYSSFPILLLIGVWVYFMRQMQGGAGGAGRGAMSFGKSRARMLNVDQIKITFNDVAGCDEAKQEVAELVEFLKDPGKFQKLGGKIPRGVLMVGSPGTGKTLLAKAIAGEAGVPFFSISGSDFVEMFVGVGASRVRDMFEQAKKHAPCIIFIDEIDAVGRHRGAGMGGGHDEREQTLNQMLVEMDGFEGNEGVIVIAATNRPDVLDPALLRPGRFDRQVVVPLPDVRGREQILKVHMRNVPLHDNVKPNTVARATPGFSGADLANLVNEAALFAARGNKKLVDHDDFERARDKIYMGAERRSMVMTEEERLMTAYHESGHTIVGHLSPGHDPIHKVTIIPRGRALGVTFYLPEGDKHSRTKEFYESRIASAFGGRIAEELIYGPDKITSGATSDIEQATRIARDMVTKFGLSDLMGPVAYSEEEGQPFLGRGTSTNRAFSDETAHAIDLEVRRIIDRNYKRARDMLQEHIEKLHAMARALMKYETIDAEQVKSIMDGKEPQPPHGWTDDGGNRPNSPKPDGNAPAGAPPTSAPAASQIFKA